MMRLKNAGRLSRTRVVRLDVIRINVRARRFDERLGFRIAGREAVGERDGEVEMEHFLDGRVWRAAAWMAASRAEDEWVESYRAQERILRA